MEQYKLAFEPIQIGPVEVSNRIYFSPHGNPMSVGGAPSDDFAWYYAERAAGGVGLALQSLPAFPAQVGRQCPFDAEQIPSFAAMADLIHSYGTKIFGQLQYWWSSAGTWETFSPSKPSLGPSANQRFDHYSVTHELSVAEIQRLIAAFAQSARHLREAGYDGVELHCSHGIIAEQFLSPYWNKRTDEYGGDLDARLRLLRELIGAAREAIGSDMALGMRFNVDEMLPRGWGQDGAKEILAKLDGLLDFVDLDVAVEPNQFPLGMPNYQIPKFSNEGFARNVREATSAVVLCAIGRATSVADAERALQNGSADLVGIARGLIAEPRLVAHAREGTESRARTCIACNYCMEAVSFLGAFGCAINPASGRERRWGVARLGTAAKPVRTVVVGGGPAGLEAARIAALRGNDVVLVEQEGRLGGQYVTWSSLPGRAGYMDAIAWYERELPELGVEVRLGAEASEETVLAERPTSVIVATGSRYVRTGDSGFVARALPGAEQEFVYSPEEVILNDRRPRGRVVVLDDEGLNAGVGVAEVLAREGCEVEIVSRWLHIAHNLFGTFELPLVIPQLRNLGVRLTPQTYVKSIGDRTVTVFDVFTNREEVRETIDGVVLVTMRRPVNELSAALDGKVEQLFTIGDALSPRGHAEAYYEGGYFGRLIGEPEAPKTFADAFFRSQPLDAYPRKAEAVQVPAGASGSRA
jgi:2,4-dienoyl-CoA reductase-like NADH-dependent reductase (Old Yellow Enzyme family)/thioredoxin reductase